MINLKKIRLNRGCTQKTLAKHLNVSRSTISGWESGKHEPDNDVLIKMSKYFDVSIEELLNEKAKNTELLSYEEIEILNLFKVLSQREKREAINYLKFQIYQKNNCSK